MTSRQRGGEPMTAPKQQEGWPWPPTAYAGDDPEWITYLHRAYYLLGMLWAVGYGDKAITALCDAAPKPPMRSGRFQ